MGKMMRLGRSIALMPLLMLAACESPKTQTIATVDGVPTAAPPATGVTAPHYILCSLDPVISYAAPKPDEVETAANKLDSDATVGDAKTRGTIRYHNTVVRAACGN